MTGSPFVLAGLVIVIVAIVGGIAATIVRTRTENSFSRPARGNAYEPPDSNDNPVASADLSKLSALMGAHPSAPAIEDDDNVSHAGEVTEYHAAEPPDVKELVAETSPPDIIDIPERDEHVPLPGLWAHLVATEDGPLPAQDRLDMVARLEMVGEKWCIDALHSATDEEQDPQVNAAVRAALTRIAG